MTDRECLLIAYGALRATNVDANIAEMVSAEKFYLKEVLEKNLVREGRKTRIKDNLIE